MTEMRDELLEQVVEELRTLPPVNEAAVARIVRAAADVEAVRGARFEVHGWSWRRSWSQPRIPLAAAAGLALAAGVAGYAVRSGSSAAPAASTAAAPPAESLIMASARRAGAGPEAGGRTSHLPVPTQFVLDAPRASRVALVGDFNGWDLNAAPLTRDSASGLWTATVPLLPGRHVYAFLVDGKTWTLDPRAPTARDPEFETPSSVVLVGMP